LHQASVKRIYELEAPKPKPMAEPTPKFIVPQFLEPLSIAGGSLEGDTVQFRTRLVPETDPDLQVFV